LIGACGDSTSPGGGGVGGGGGGPIPADVSIVLGAQTKGFAAYDPGTITLQLNGGAAGKGLWRNDDANGIDHTVTDTLTPNRFTSRTITTAVDTGSVTFTAAGEYQYKCSIHPGMRGLVIVQP